MPAPLGRLTADPGRFASDVWGRRPELVERHGAFDDLFSLADADRLVASALRPPALRMVSGGTVLDAAEFCSTTRLGGREVADVADPRKVADRLANGATLVLQSLHRQWPPLTEFADTLTADLGHPVQVNAYLTPPGAAGLAPHADEHDVFAVQLDGTKQWWVDQLGDLVLRPGDVLYVPAGWRHSARTDHCSSLHLTVGVLRITYRHVVERWLRAHVGELDAPLPLGYRASGSAASGFTVGVGRALSSVAAALQAADPSTVAAAERSRPIRPYSSSGHVTSVVGRAELDVTALIRWATVAPRWESLPDTPDGRSWMRLKLADRVLRLPAGARNAIDRLASVGTLRVGELPGLDPVSQCVLARRLVAEHACVIA